MPNLMMDGKRCIAVDLSGGVVLYEGSAEDALKLALSRAGQGWENRVTIYAPVAVVSKKYIPSQDAVQYELTPEGEKLITPRSKKRARG